MATIAGFRSVGEMDEGEARRQRRADETQWKKTLHCLPLKFTIDSRKVVFSVTEL